MAVTIVLSIRLVQFFLPPCVRGDGREKSTVGTDQFDFLAVFDFDDLGLACLDDDAGLESLNEDLLIDGG